MTIALFYGRHLGKELPIVLYPTGRAEVITEETVIYPSAEVTHPALLTDWERNLVHNCWKDNA